MMMPSTMILTICISMVLKRNHGLSLDIGSRHQSAEHKTLITNLKSWIQSLPQTDAEAASNQQTVMRSFTIIIPYFDICMLCWSSWIGTGGGSKPIRQTQNFSVTSVGRGGHLQPVEGSPPLPNFPPPRQIERWLRGFRFPQKPGSKP